MATKRKLPSTVHATARAQFNPNGGFGHLTIHVYDLFGYSGPSLKISCQTTGGPSDSPKESYAWKLGLSSEYEVVGLEALKTGYYLMARIDRELKKMTDEYGRAYTFAEYAARVLRAADIPVVHILEQVNGQLALGRNFTDLEGLSPRNDKVKIVEAFTRMEKALLAL